MLYRREETRGLRASVMAWVVFGLITRITRGVIWVWVMLETCVRIVDFFFFLGVHAVKNCVAEVRSDCRVQRGVGRSVGSGYFYILAFALPKVNVTAAKVRTYRTLSSKPSSLSHAQIIHIVVSQGAAS